MAILGAGSKFQVSIASVYTDVLYVISIDGPDIATNDVDTTHLNSPNYTREYMPDWLEPNAIALTANFDAATMTTLYGFWRTTQLWKVLLSNGSAWTFGGHINKLTTQVALEGAIHIAWGVKVTGKPVFAA